MHKTFRWCTGSAPTFIPIETWESSRESPFSPTTQQPFRHQTEPWCLDSKLTINPAPCLKTKLLDLVQLISFFRQRSRNMNLIQNSAANKSTMAPSA